MTGTNYIANELLLSELALAFIPRRKFKLGASGFSDVFIDFAEDVFAVALANLVANKFLLLEKETVKEHKILGIKVSSDTHYELRISKKFERRLPKGWLEEKIFEQFKKTACQKLEILVFNVLLDLLGDKEYINPGKVFLLELLLHQKKKRFRVEVKTNWALIKTVILHPEPNQGEPLLNPLELDFSKTGLFELTVFKKTIGKELAKFRDTD